MAGRRRRELGLYGEVEPDQLVGDADRDQPGDGRAAWAARGPGRGPVPGFDLTFSAPKSVSLTWALGGGKVAAEVKAAHQRSVEVALAYMQHHACLTRRGARRRRSSSTATASSPPATSIAPRETAIPSCIPTC